MPSIILSDNGVGSGSAGIKTTGASDGTLALQTTTSGGTATTAVTIDTSQNVGIGTSSPSYKLQIGGSVGAGTSPITAYLNQKTSWNSADYEAMQLGLSQLRSVYVSGNNWDLTFQTYAGSFTEKMRLDYNGNLLVGTTTASSKLTVNSEMSFAADNNNRGIVGWDNTGKGLYFGTINAGTTYFNSMTLKDGNLLVGTTTSGGVGFSLTSNAGAICTTTQRASGTGATNMCLYVNPNGTVGTIQISGSSTSYNTSSDYRLKNTVAPMTGALARVAALKPVTYKWNADDSDGEGFIAHELAEVVPQCVTGEKDATRIEQYEISPAVPATFDEEGNELTAAVEAVMGEREVPVYQGIDTSFLVATLTAAIQEQQALIQTLTERISALEAK